MDCVLWEYPRNTPVPQGTTGPPLSRTGEDVSATVRIMEFGGSIFWLLMRINFLMGSRKEELFSRLTC